MKERDERARKAIDTHVGLGRFIRTITKPRLLRPEEEADLAKRIAAGAAAAVELEPGVDDGTRVDGSVHEGMDSTRLRTLRRIVRDGQRAKERLLRHNMRLAVNMARRFTSAATSREYSFEDRLQEATLGLMRAVEGFDATKGYRFSTYASWWIRQSLQRGAFHTGAVQLPAHVWELLGKVWAARNKLVDAGGVITAQTLSIVADLPIADVETAIELQPKLAVIRLDKPIMEGVTRAELLASSDESTQRQALRRTLAADVRASLSHLDPRTTFILEKRFGFDDDREWTLEEVGRELGLTRERVRQLQKAGLQKLSGEALLQELL